MPLCIAAGTVSAVIATSAFTLAWTHSIEKIRWEEDWHVESGALVLDEARIRGTGAGMEPPADARHADGIWRYRPALPPLPALQLAHSPHATGYELCIAQACLPLAERLPGLGTEAVVELRPC